MTLIEGQGRPRQELVSLPLGPGQGQRQDYIHRHFPRSLRADEGLALLLDQKPSQQRCRITFDRPHQRQQAHQQPSLGEAFG